MKGQQALAYVRTRHALGNGSDLARIDRQQAFLGSMVSKIKSKGMLLDPDRLCNFLAAATNSLTTDPCSAASTSCASLAKDVKDIATKNVTFLTAPNEPYPADPNRVQLKPSAATRVERAALRPAVARQGAEAHLDRRRTTPSGPPLVTAPEKISVAGAQRVRHQGRGQHRVAEQLTAEGFNVVGVGNADRTATTRRPRCCTTRRTTSPGRTLGAAITGSTVTAGRSLGSTLTVVVGTDSPQRRPRSTSAARPASPAPTETLADPHRRPATSAPDPRTLGELRAWPRVPRRAERAAPTSAPAAAAARPQTRSISSAAEAVADIADGATLAVGGFGLCGIPSVLIAALHDAGTNDLQRRVEQLRRRRLGPRRPARPTTASPG